jgi:hypothetical protein
VYYDDKLAAPREHGGHDHIKGRPDEWSNYYPGVEWTGILDSEGRILINDDVWSWHTIDVKDRRMPMLDYPIGVVFRVFRDQFSDPTWNKARSRWKSIETKTGSK